VPGSISEAENIFGVVVTNGSISPDIANKNFGITAKPQVTGIPANNIITPVLSRRHPFQQYRTPVGQKITSTMSQILPVSAVVMISMSSVLSVRAQGMDEKKITSSKKTDLDRMIGKYFYCPKFDEMPCQNRDDPCQIGEEEKVIRMYGLFAEQFRTTKVWRIVYKYSRRSRSKTVSETFIENTTWEKAINNSECYTMPNPFEMPMKPRVKSSKKTDLDKMIGEYFYCPNFEKMPCQNRDEPCQIGEEKTVSPWLFAVLGGTTKVGRIVYKYGRKLPDQPRSKTVSETFIENTTWEEAISNSECYTMPDRFGMPLPMFTELNPRVKVNFYCPLQGAATPKITFCSDRNDPSTCKAKCADVNDPCEAVLSESNSAVFISFRGRDAIHKYYTVETTTIHSPNEWNTNYMASCMQI